MSTDLTPERKLCDWIDANGIVTQGATPSMLLSAAGLDALTARAEAAERDLAAVTVSRDGWKTRAEAAEKAVAKVREVAIKAADMARCDPDPTGYVEGWCDASRGLRDDLRQALDTHTPETETTP